MVATIDWVILLGLFLSLLFGAWRGLVKEALSLLSWVSAFFVSISFVSDLSPFFAQLMGAEIFAFPLSFLSLFVGTMLVFSSVSFLLNEALVFGGLKGLDRFMGVVFGIVRGSLIVVIVCVICRFLAPGTYSQWHEDSIFVPQFMQVFDYIWDLVWETPPLVY